MQVPGIPGLTHLTSCPSCAFKAFLPIAAAPISAGPNLFCRQEGLKASDFIAASSRKRPILIRGASIVDVTARGEIKPPSDVLIRDGRIAGIAPRIDAPDGAYVVGAAGRFLMTGLSDEHAHPVTMPIARAYFGQSDDKAPDLLPYRSQMLQWLATGVTRIHAMAGDPDLLWIRDEVAGGSMLGPKMIVSSPLIDGDPPVMGPALSWVVTTREEGRRAVRRARDEGYDRLKVYNNLPREAFEAAADEAARIGIPLEGHVPSAVGVKHAIDCGQQLIAHISQFTTCLVPEPRFDEERVKRLAAQAADRDVWVQTTLIVVDGLQKMARGRMDELFASADIDFCAPLVRATYGSNPESFSYITSNSRWNNVLEYSLETMAHLRAAGVRMLSGTDAPSGLLADGFSLHGELALLVEQGNMTPAEALRASTLLPAIYAGEEHDYGSVEVGKIADLLLLDADPLADIANTRQIQAVMKGGELFARSGLDSILTQILAQNRLLSERLSTSRVSH